MYSPFWEEIELHCCKCGEEHHVFVLAKDLSHYTNHDDVRESFPYLSEYEVEQLEKNICPKCQKTSKTKYGIVCPFCSRTHFVELYDSDYKSWQNNSDVDVQHIFPYLTATEREQLISRICPECQKAVFDVGVTDE